MWRTAIQNSFLWNTGLEQAADSNKCPDYHVKFEINYEGLKQRKYDKCLTCSQQSMLF